METAPEVTLLMRTARWEEYVEWSISGSARKNQNSSLPRKRLGPFLYIVARGPYRPSAWHEGFASQSGDFEVWRALDSSGRNLPLTNTANLIQAWKLLENRSQPQTSLRQTSDYWLCFHNQRAARNTWPLSEPEWTRPFRSLKEL